MHPIQAFRKPRIKALNTVSVKKATYQVNDIAEVNLNAALLQVGEASRAMDQL